ncbi:Na+/Pi symporter [Collariella sp. IMI 366227]|nr:Na+/Pi symporter [Collariella sp. IMI 366227]
MPALPQFDYLFAIGTIFAALDAWNIGANDVANSWATSVASQSVTYLQAMVLASVMEFAGSVGVGARVADTIRTKVVDTSLFDKDPALLMLGMVCAVCASSIYLTFATKIGMPVSTTHSIMGGVIGMGVAAIGADGIQWVGKGSGVGAINSGVVQVFLAWIIAPGLSAVFASIIFLITKYGVMLRSNPVRNALYFVPFYFGLTACLLTMLLLWKGGGYTITLTDPEVAGTIVGVGAAFALLIAATLMPWLYRVVILDDWQLRWYHIPLGLFLIRRGEVPPHPDDAGPTIKDYYEGRMTKEELDARKAGERNDIEVVPALTQPRNPTPQPLSRARKPRKKFVGPKPEGAWYTGAVLFWYIKWALLRGIDQEVVHAQSTHDGLARNLEEVHAHAAHYDNRAEYMYSFLQVMTAATASFTHGANDIANAIGPYATVFQIWNDGKLPPKGKSEVPVWILVFGELPISTTQCITGATVGVGLCSGTWRTVNWRMVAWIYLGWIITLPLTGILSGCLMGIIINAPRWGYSG